MLPLLSLLISSAVALSPAPYGQQVELVQAAVPIYSVDAPPPYVDGADNLVEYANPAAVTHIALRWDDPGNPPVVIAHFGDSHVQKGYITEAARLALEAQRGVGGRGMVFPYAIARTYSQNDLDSTFSGTWRTGNSVQQPPRIPVGIAGFAAQTSDPFASVTLTFKRPLDPGMKHVRVFYVAQGGSYTLTLGSGGSSLSQQVQGGAGTSVAIADFDADSLADTIGLQLVATQPGSSFTLLGISIENRPATGVLYHNLGVGGAMYQALLQQTWFEPEIRAIAPDLVILDWGTNDLIYTVAPAGNFEQIVTRTIARVRRAVPDASILLTSTQDMTFRTRRLESGALSSGLRRIAFENGCLYWDWYRISGGYASSAHWRADTLLGSDGVHLTGRGYRLKGGLLATALMKTLAFARKNPKATSLVILPDRSSTPPRASNPWELLPKDP